MCAHETLMKLAGKLLAELPDETDVDVLMRQVRAGFALECTEACSFSSMGETTLRQLCERHSENVLRAREEAEAQESEGERECSGNCAACGCNSIAFALDVPVSLMSSHT